LCEQIKKVVGGEVIFGSANNCPPEILEQFLENVLAVETAPRTTHLELLARQGIYLQPPDELDDASLHDALWKVIQGLANQQTYVYHTNHLSDRELYTRLWKDSLREWAIDAQGNPDAGSGIDLVSSGSDEDTYLDLRYYADDLERARWMKEFPDYKMPVHEDPPYDRDRSLPRRGWPWDAPLDGFISKPLG
jgi:hypothetical protein